MFVPDQRHTLECTKLPGACYHVPLPCDTTAGTHKPADLDTAAGVSLAGQDAAYSTGGWDRDDMPAILVRLLILWRLCKAHIVRSPVMYFNQHCKAHSKPFNKCMMSNNGESVEKAAERRESCLKRTLLHSGLFTVCWSRVPPLKKRSHALLMGSGDDHGLRNI